MRYEFPSQDSVWEQLKPGDKIMLETADMLEIEFLVEQRLPMGHAEWPGDPDPGDRPGFRVPMVLIGKSDPGTTEGERAALLFDLGPQRGFATVLCGGIDHEVLVLTDESNESDASDSEAFSTARLVVADALMMSQIPVDLPEMNAAARRVVGALLKPDVRWAMQQLTGGSK